MTQQRAQGAMEPYRIDFYRTVTNNAGVTSKCVIETITIARARGYDRAVQAALRRFQRRNKVAAWHHVAHGYEYHPASSNARSAD